MSRPLAALALTLVATLTACGGGGGGTSSSTKSSASSAPCPKGAVVVHMANIQFAPDKATAKVGETVCWVNDDDIQHDVIADGKQFQSSLFGKGHTFTWKAAKAGAVPYVCSVHPAMTATLTVTG
jgi:plastocyanin